MSLALPSCSVKRLTVKEVASASASHLAALIRLMETVTAVVSKKYPAGYLFVYERTLEISQFWAIIFHANAVTPGQKPDHFA